MFIVETLGGNDASARKIQNIKAQPKLFSQIYRHRHINKIAIKKIIFMKKSQMPLVAAPAAAAPQATRKPSLKEQPSYLKVVLIRVINMTFLIQEVSVALNRGEELKKLKERLSAAKLIMEKDPSAKPWMLSRSAFSQKALKAFTWIVC